ncbi:MAG TPA: TetR/AcrR family transcriptional regulator [Acidimicrobiales bacterium]|nr:TetR/AcrR family transcriptional regulator [Acidimicrobiales bacterium]
MPETAVDRRLARGVETRRRLAEAMIALLEEGVPQPSAREIAERAGVSLRLVFHHFEDMEQVLRAAVAVQVSRHWNRLHPVDPSLPLGERVERIIRQRETLYEAIAPVRRAAARAELESPTIATELSRARRQLRRGLEATFEAELHSASHDERLDALDVAGSWETWDLLRTRMGVGRAMARRVVARMMTSLLEDQGGSK